jgi:hypothetical protein
MESESMNARVNESTDESWEIALSRRLPFLGHRNWIVIADAAYPAQSAAGLTTILAGVEQLEVIRHTLSAVAAPGHVKPKVYLDRELSFVDEADAAGITAYRTALVGLLHGFKVEAAQHNEIIARLDQVARRFEVLIIKTSLQIPYTSVFLELDCAYWNESAEARLRARMAKATD